MLQKAFLIDPSVAFVRDQAGGPVGAPKCDRVIFRMRDKGEHTGTPESANRSSSRSSRQDPTLTFDEGWLIVAEIDD